MIVPLILAAGAGRRMGITKALAVWESETFLRRIVSSCAACEGLDVPIVVIGAQAQAVREAHQDLAVRWLENPHWSTTDMMSSVRLGLGAKDPASAALVWPIDCPRVPAAVIGALVDAFTGEACVPMYQGRPGHPVVLGATLCGKVLLDLSIPHLRAALEGALCVTTECPEILDNINRSVC